MAVSLRDADYILYRGYGGTATREERDAYLDARRAARERQARRWGSWWHGRRV
jgi:hypothetical protein